jgi:hypothetical protein
MIKAEFKFNMNLPKLDFSDQLLDIAERIFVKNIQSNMDNEVDIAGMFYPSLAESTIKSKMRKGLSPLILHATNKLRNSFPVRKIAQNKVIITSKRMVGGKNLGDILQNKGVISKVHGVRKFHFFDVNKKMSRLGSEYMAKALVRVIKDAKY